MTASSNKMAYPEINAFLHELSVVRKLSTHTIKAYEQDLKKLIHFMSEQNIAVEAVTPLHTRSWMAKMHGAGLSARSIARTISAWRNFYQWLMLDAELNKRQIITVNPLGDLRAPKRPKNLPKALSVEQVMALVDFAKKEAQSELEQFPITSISKRVLVRDWALIELFYSSGLRLSEILGIDVQQKMSSTQSSLGWIDWSSQEVNVLGKGGKRRIVPVGNAAMDALNVWRKTLIELAHPVEQALFVNEQFERLSPRTVQARLKKLAIRASLPTHVHPHMLRHSFASHVLQSSHDLRAVQEMLGHASIGSTQIYTALDFQHLAQAYDLAHPRAKSNK